MANANTLSAHPPGSQVTMEEFLAHQAALINTFNGIIKKLLVALVSRYPEDAKIVRTKKRVFLAIEELPSLVINIVGPYLFRYSEQITSQNDSFFLDTNYDEELNSSNDREKAEVVAYIIPKIKASWRKAGGAERAEYAETVIDLLYTYVDYKALSMGMAPN